MQQSDLRERLCGSCRHWGDPLPVWPPLTGATPEGAAPKRPSWAWCIPLMQFVTRHARCEAWEAKA